MLFVERIHYPGNRLNGIPLQPVIDMDEGSDITPQRTVDEVSESLPGGRIRLFDFAVGENMRTASS